MALRTRTAAAAVVLAAVAVSFPLSAVATTCGGPSADLGIYVTPLRVGVGEAHNFRTGETAAFQIDIVNLGDDPAQKVVVVDTLPAGFTASRVAAGLGRSKQSRSSAASSRGRR